MARQYNRDAGGRFAAAKQEGGDRPNVAEARTRRAPRKSDPDPSFGDDEVDTSGEEVRSDFGPWAETPASSRVRSYRYDYMNQATQVTWRNNKNPGYVYEGMEYEQFRAFARAASKGKYINSTLNGFSYRPCDATEISLPSNSRRRGPTARVRG